jgi:hypothetical protein
METLYLRSKKMESVLEKYSMDIPSAGQARRWSGRGAWSVILTGTTRSLGTRLLAALEAMPEAKAAKNFYLNRSSNAKERQKK